MTYNIEYVNYIIEHLTKLGELETKKTFYYFLKKNVLQGPELLSKYIGASEQAVRDTFLR